MSHNIWSQSQGDDTLKTWTETWDWLNRNGDLFKWNVGFYQTTEIADIHQQNGNWEQIEPEMNLDFDPRNYVNQETATLYEIQK